MKPKIRLKGFEGEWEEKPLRQICFKESSSIAMDSLGLSKGEYPLFGASGYIQNIEYYQQKKPYVGIVKDGAGVGRANLYPAKSSLLGTMQYILPKTDTDVGFLGYLINKTNLSIYNTGSTIPHIYFKDYGEQSVTIPSFLEQQSIANYFKSLDALIQSTTQKVASLMQLKEASLISMFPQGGETTPRVRFKGFEGKWKEKPLHQICFKESSSIAMDSLGMPKGEYPLFGASGYIQNIEYYQQEKPYVGIVKDGAGVGRANLYPAKSSLLGTMQYILPKSDIDVGFLGYLINKTNLSIYNTGSTIPHIYFKDYGEQSVTIPSFLEQQHIASYFQNLDSQIRLQEQRIEKLKQIKTACLYQMFV